MERNTDRFWDNVLPGYTNQGKGNTSDTAGAFQWSVFLPNESEYHDEIGEWQKKAYALILSKQRFGKKGPPPERPANYHGEEGKKWIAAAHDLLQLDNPLTDDDWPAILWPHIIWVTERLAQVQNGLHNDHSIAHPIDWDIGSRLESSLKFEELWNLFEGREQRLKS